MLKGAFDELNPDVDCIGRVKAFEYVIPVGLCEVMEMGAALLTGAHEEPPTTVIGIGAGCSTTCSTCEVEACVWWVSCIRLSTATGTNALLTMLWAAQALQAFFHLPPFRVLFLLDSP